MPKYVINGHTYESPTELTDDEIDEIGGWDQPEEKGTWEKLNTPFTNKISEFGKSVGKWIDPEQGTDWRNPRTALGAFAESVGSTVENMFATPMGFATAIAFPGATALGKTALNPAVIKAAPTVAKYLPTAAKAVHTGGRVGAGLYGIEGAKSAIEGVGEGDIPKALMGGLGAYLGQKGARYPYAAPVAPKKAPSMGVPSGQEYTPPPPVLGYGETPSYRTNPMYGATSYGEVPRATAPPTPPNIPPPVEAPPTPPPSPMAESIADTIREINRKHAQAAPLPSQFADQVIPPSPEMQINQAMHETRGPRPVTETPFTEAPPFDPRDPRVMPNAPIMEPPPSGTVGPPPTPYVPPEVTTPNMVPQRPILDRTLTQNMDINPLSELAARRGARESAPPRTHAEPAMGLEPETIPEPIPETIPEPPVAESFTDPLRPVTAPPIMPPPATVPAGRKGGLRPRQKFETKTFAPGPPRPTAPPVEAPPQAPVVPSEVTPRLVKKPTAQAPVEQPLEHAIATNGDQLDQLMTEGYKAVGKRTDGAIVMERVAPEAPPKPNQRPLAEEIAEGQARRRAEYEASKRRNAVQWGASRKRAKELGIDLGKEKDIKAVEKLIKAKDPNWSTPEVKGAETPPTEAHEMMPKDKAKGPSWRPGGLKRGLKYEPEVKPDTGIRKWYNEARGFMSVDFPLFTSAAFRQGMPFIGTKYWNSAFSPAAKAYKSQNAYQEVMRSINVDKLFRPQFDPKKLNPRMQQSIAEQLGLKFIKAGEIAGAEGVTRGPLSSKAPWIAASDRSFAAFTNHLRAWTFKRLLKDAGVWDETSGMITNEPLAREIADFVNTASGRGKLEIGYGTRKGQTRSLETSAKILTDLFFSPRLMFSRMKMMNPATYMQASPFVRKQYTSAMIRTIGSWWTIASLAEWGGKLSGVDVKVNKDPNNADYGKIRIGNTRIDPGGGFQQFLVMTHRLMPKYGKSKVAAGTPIPAVDLALGLLKAGGGVTTSSVSGNQSVLGAGYKAETRGDILERFVVSKFHPTAKLAYDAAHASEKYPVYLGDRLLQMALPMMIPDVVEALQKDPEMAPLIFVASNLGMGAQTYEGGRIEKPAIMPKKLQKYDWAIGAK